MNRCKPSISVKILAIFLTLIFFVQSIAPAYSYDAAYKQPRYTNLAPAPFSERDAAEYKVGTSLIVMIEKNPIVPIDVLTLEGIDAILRRNQRFLTENGVTFLPGYHEIKISFGKGIILRYADADVHLSGIQGFVSTSQERTGPFIRQVLRKEAASAPVIQEQLELDFTRPLVTDIKVSDETEAAIPVVSATDIPCRTGQAPEQGLSELRDGFESDSKIFAGSST